MKAFIGRSFKDEDAGLIRQIADFIESQGIDCGDAKSAKSRKVEEKIRGLISECDIFIGVFTRNEPICKEEKKTKWYCKPRNKNTIFTTSNWVIQESGFALGKDKELILLIENGVYELPKLQGNFEYISFDKSSIEKTFLQINQMISDIKAKISGGATERSIGELTSPDEGKPEEQEGKPKKEIQDKKEEVLNRVYAALWRDESYIEAQKIFNDEAEALLDEEDKAPTRAIILRLSQPLGDTSAFEKLQKLVQENEDNPRVIKQLAHRYKGMGEFKKAEEQFLLASEKYDVNDAEKKPGFVDAHVQAAWCLAYDDDYNSSIAMLKKLLFDSKFQEQRDKLFEAMAKISKEKDQTENFLVYAEAALDANPSNTDLRFDIAYVYFNNNNNKLALLHYKKLTDTIKHRVGQNNMGVACGALKLKSKAVSCYFKAAKEKYALPMSNLAYLYIDEGFTDDAQKLINEANKLASEGITVNSRVGSAQQKLDTLLDDETKKEKDILLNAEKERKFRVDYSKAFCSESTITQNNIEGIWETQWGNFELKFDENVHSFSMEGNVRIEDTLASIASLISGNQKQEKEFKNRNVRITGTIENMSGMCSIEVEDKKGSTILTGEKVHETTDYMIINEDCNCIEIMEKTKDNKTEFKQWKKHEENVGK